MTPARLEELRKSLDTEEYTSYLPKTVRELLDYIDSLKFANGVLDSAAKDAQAWQHEAQTATDAYCELLEANRVTEAEGGVIAQLNGMIDELRAQLEVQRGEFSHIEASARYKALGLPDDVQMHAIFLEGWNGGMLQRGGAVVVPELTDIELSACERLARMCRKSPSLVEGYLGDIKPWEAAEAIEKAATRQAIPADRVLGGGEISMARVEISAAFKAGFDFSKDWRNNPSNSEYVNELFRLRSAKGEVK